MKGVIRNGITYDLSVKPEEINKTNERALSETNKSYRELLETANVFSDAKYCREAWKSIGMAVLLSEAKTVAEEDTREGAIESYTYAKLSQELKGLGRKPTELEMILHCQSAKARWDTGAAIFMRDTVGAKPIDESKVVVNQNQYETMSDDEIEMLYQYRLGKASVEGTVGTVEGTSGTVEGTSGTVEGTAELANATVEGPTLANATTYLDGDDNAGESDD